MKIIQFNCKKFNCKIIIQKKRGYGSAIIEGFENAKSKYGCIFNLITHLTQNTLMS